MNDNRAMDEDVPATLEAFLAAAVGEPEADVTYQLRAAGYTVRVVHRDGVARVVTRDYRLNRVNLTVEQGRVVRTTVG